MESDGGGKGGVVKSDGGEREEWWTVLNGQRGKGRECCWAVSSMCALVVLSVGSHAWVARCHCVREVHRRPWVGVVGWRWVVVLFVGSGCHLWVWGAVRGHWVVGGQVACGCWFVIRARSGDVSSAVWSSLVRLEGTRVGYSPLMIV